jgi:hypothetical protein
MHELVTEQQIKPGCKESMAMAKTGPKIRKGRGSLVPELPANHPVYTRGFAIGVVRSTSPKPTVLAPVAVGTHILYCMCGKELGRVCDATGETKYRCDVIKGYDDIAFCSDSCFLEYNP